MNAGRPEWRRVADQQLTTSLRTFTDTKIFVATFFTLSFLDSKFGYLNYSNRVLWIPIFDVHRITK
jgi:hypothetical protein